MSTVGNDIVLETRGASGKTNFYAAIPMFVLEAWLKSQEDILPVGREATPRRPHWFCFTVERISGSRDEAPCTTDSQKTYIG